MFRRLYHCSCILHSNKKQGIKLCKMLNPRSKKQWYPSPTSNIVGMPSVKSLTKIKHEPGKQGVRRVAVLNKLFMKYISDLLSTGTVSMQIVGNGIQISKVQVSQDFKTVNVYWICNGDSTDEETESLLHSVGGPLRHELSTLRLMGEVPYIVFVKDRHEAHLVDLDRRLTIADYGEDYTPTDLGYLLKSDFTLNTKLTPELKRKIQQLEEEQPKKDDPVPEMTHNVFGLDHAKTMNRLLAARKKTKDAWDSLNDDTVITYRANPKQSDSLIDLGKQKQELADFLLKRQILQNKLHKRMRNDPETLREVQEEQEFVDEIYEEEYEEDIDDINYENNDLEKNRS